MKKMIITAVTSVTLCAVVFGGCMVKANNDHRTEITNLNIQHEQELNDLERERDKAVVEKENLKKELAKWKDVVRSDDDEAESSNTEDSKIETLKTNVTDFLAEVSN